MLVWHSPNCLLKYSSINFQIEKKSLLLEQRSNEDGNDYEADDTEMAIAGSDNVDDDDQSPPPSNVSKLAAKKRRATASSPSNQKKSSVDLFEDEEEAAKQDETVPN